VSADHYAAVPGHDGATLVVIDGRLPCVRSGWQLPEVLDDFAPLIGRPPYLRLAARAHAEPDNSLRLHTFDSGATGELLSLDEADPGVLAPAELRPALEQWLSEQRGAPVPALRPPWARPGWHAEAETWAGSALEPVRSWPLSAVLRGETGWLKAVFPLFHHEPAVTEALAREHPRHVPSVLRADHERGWLLLDELPGKHVEDGDRTAAAAALRALAEIHRSWSGRAGELIGLGAQDRRRNTGSLPLPDTLVHGDFHPGNAMFDGTRAAIFDWSDACVAHPLFDLHLFLFWTEDEDARSFLVDAYAEPWAGMVSADELRAALPHAAPLSCLHQAESYHAIHAACAPDDRWWFAGEEERWRERASAARAGTQTSPGT
jgi:hypothetical protein